MPGGLLIIENENAFRHNLAQRLRTESYKVFVAQDPVEIKKLLKRKRIEAVLLSLVEMKASGLQLLSLVKELKPSLEVILINASDAVPLSIKGMKLGAFDDFFLPLDYTVLLDRIKQAVSRSRQGKKKKKPLLKRYEELMLAITMAEAGSHDEAQRILNSTDTTALEEHPLSKDRSTRKTNRDP